MRGALAVLAFWLSADRACQLDSSAGSAALGVDGAVQQADWKTPGRAALDDEGDDEGACACRLRADCVRVRNAPTLPQILTCARRLPLFTGSFTRMRVTWSSTGKGFDVSYVDAAGVTRRCARDHGQAGRQELARRNATCL